MRRVGLVSWVLVLCCLCCIACGRRVRGGTGVPQDSGSDTDAGGTDAGNTDASADGSVDASSDSAANDAASTGDASADAGTDSGNVITTTPPDSSCDGAEFNGHTYWFCTANFDWDSARTRCTDINGDLVAINDAPEQAFIEVHAPLGTWLIGLNKKNASGSSTIGVWEMVDGTTLASYANWGGGEPGGSDCGALDGSGQWQDFSCTNNENWICEIP